MARLNRRGNWRTRQAEFRAVVRAVKTNKARFIARLQRQVKALKSGCVVWTGYKRDEGYGRLSLRLNGRHLCIDTQRVFLILMLGRAIRLGFDAGHTCQERACVRHLIEQPMEENALTDPTAKHLHDKKDSFPF